MAALPQVKVESDCKIYDDGNHNAFTDMIKFGDKYYIAFRSSPISHYVTAQSEIIVLASNDCVNWDKVYSFSVEIRDVRDPHFLIFNNKLFIYSGTWLCDPKNTDENKNVNEHLGYAVFTEDGKNWSTPQSLEGTYGHYIWRAAEHEGKAYMIGRRIYGFIPSDYKTETHVKMQTALLESDDGVIWKFRSIIADTKGNETALLFEENGDLLALARINGGAILYKSSHPYEEWSNTELDRFIGGPMLVKIKDCYLTGGRKTSEDGPKTVLSWISNGKFVDCAELPSGGDNSYPGFVMLDENNAAVSYYSSHEGSGDTTAPCSIYLAKISF